ncbi:MAG: aldolase/citrate lyase family protein [Chloroflexi bacterium]|nr:aldolase/citrate lyase family protein [Chloroflexota bacterium]
MEKIRGGKEVRIAGLGYVLPPFLAYAAHSGYDCIILDLEHHPMDDGEVLTLLALSHLYDIDIMVRPESRGGVRLGRFLEDGAAGLLIPRVNSAAEVRDLVEKVKFPPVGDRGMAARSPNLWAHFGLEVADDQELHDGHVSLANQALSETFLILQLETPAGIADLDEMAAVPGFEGFFVGPADLALRMQYEPEERRVSYEETLRRLSTACQRHDLVWGSFAGDVAELREFTWPWCAAAVVGHRLGSVACGSGGLRERVGRVDRGPRLGEELN